MRVYHTGKLIIREPDVHYGRKNADFGQGFYLTPDRDFTRRWAGEEAVVNEYELELTGLTVRRFERGEDWFRYIFQNRRGEDELAVGVVIGPIANDTIFDTMGVISSGFLRPEEALALLRVGPAYTQIALKTEKAAAQLRWIGAETVSRPEAARRAQEQEAYWQALSEAMKTTE